VTCHMNSDSWLPPPSLISSPVFAASKLSKQFRAEFIKPALKSCFTVVTVVLVAYRAGLVGICAGRTIEF
jgi:hypothetical protein